MDEPVNGHSPRDTPDTPETTAPDAGNRRWIFGGYARMGVRVCLPASLAVFAAYVIGSLPDPGLSDDALFFLLRILRYMSLLLCAFSLFAMGFGVRRLVHDPGARSVLNLLFYFFAVIISALLSMLDSFIVIATRGNI